MLQLISCVMMGFICQAIRRLLTTFQLFVVRLVGIFLRVGLLAVVVPQMVSLERPSQDLTLDGRAHLTNNLRCCFSRKSGLKDSRVTPNPVDCVASCLHQSAVFALTDYVIIYFLHSFTFWYYHLLCRRVPVDGSPTYTSNGTNHTISRGKGFLP